MLVHKEFVEKINEYHNYKRAMEKAELEIKEYIVKNTKFNTVEKENIWKEVHNILQEGTLEDDSEFTIAHLDLIIAQIRVKMVEAKRKEKVSKNVVHINDMVSTEVKKHE